MKFFSPLTKHEKKSRRGGRCSVKGRKQRGMYSKNAERRALPWHSLVSLRRQGAEGEAEWLPCRVNRWPETPVKWWLRWSTVHMKFLPWVQDRMAMEFFSTCTLPSRFGAFIYIYRERETLVHPMSTGFLSFSVLFVAPFPLNSLYIRDGIIW